MDESRIAIVELEQRNFMIRVYGWMSIALITTGLISIVVANTPSLIDFLIMNRLVFFGLLIAELVVVGALAGFVKKMSAVQAMFTFFAYSALNGLTLSVIFLVYTEKSIAITFFITAGTFAIMSTYGYFTKADLTSLGNLLFMALIGLILASIINLFFYNETLYWITTYAGILIFVGLTAYDTQKNKAYEHYR